MTSLQGFTVRFGLCVLSYAMVGCHGAERTPKQAVAPVISPSVPDSSGVPSRWPADLVSSVTAVQITRCRGDEPCRATRIQRRGSDGIWQSLSPRVGEADPDAVQRLLFALTSPRLVPTANLAALSGTQPAFRIELTRQDGHTQNITVFRAPLNQPILVSIESVGQFAVSPVEFATKLPDPDDLLPTGLWVSARGKAVRLDVKGPATFSLHRQGQVWTATIPTRREADLDDYAGVLTGRQAVDHPSGALAALGLDRPTATATLCTDVGECRTFRFSSATRDGVTRYFAVGPDMDPLELHDDAWRMLVKGPGLQ